VLPDDVLLTAYLAQEHGIKVEPVVGHVNDYAAKSGFPMPGSKSGPRRRDVMATLENETIRSHQPSLSHGFVLAVFAPPSPGCATGFCTSGAVHVLEN
jgi:hypothetical protein